MTTKKNAADEELNRLLRDRATARPRDDCFLYASMIYDFGVKSALGKEGHLTSGEEIAVQEHFRACGYCHYQYLDLVGRLKVAGKEEALEEGNPAVALQAELTEDAPVLLNLAASKGYTSTTEQIMEGNAYLIVVDTFEIEGIICEALTDLNSGNVFLQPSLLPHKTRIVFDETSYLLAEVEGNDNVCQVIDLGIGELQLFSALCKKEPGQHQIFFKDK